MANLSLSFIQFDTLMASVNADLRILSEEGMIEPAQLIKVAQRVNYDLGLRIHQTKETIIDIENGHGRLPEDFYVLDFALLLGKSKEIIPVDWKGRFTENVNVPCSAPPPPSNCHCWKVINPKNYSLQANIIYCDQTTEEVVFAPGETDVCANQVSNDPSNSLIITTDHYCFPTGILNQYQCTEPISDCRSCSTTSTLLTGSTCSSEVDPWFQRGVYSICDDSKCVKVIDHRQTEIREYEWSIPLYIKQQSYTDPGSINTKLHKSAYTAEIKNGYLYCPVPCAKCYISYQGALVDEDGNLLVLDHPEIRMYYEAAIKHKIFENLWYAGEEVEGKMKYADQQMKDARLKSLSIVNTPNFSELFITWAQNRQQQYKRYYETWHTDVFHARYQSLTHLI